MFDSFLVANFGGTLSLFLGFSFISLWDFGALHIGFLGRLCKRSEKIWVRIWITGSHNLLSLEISSIDHKEKELSSSIFQSLWVSQSVSKASETTDQSSTLCNIYKGIDALFWASIIKYQLSTPYSVLYWPSTQLHHLVTHSWANWI